MICLLINYYWALYLGKKIHLHWNKCQGMAREFILFVHICHWIGGKTAVPFKTSSGLLTEYHRNKMKISRVGAPTRTPGGCTDLAVCCFFFFFLRGTQISFPLRVPNFKNSQIWTCAFNGLRTFPWGLVHVLGKFAFWHRKGMGKGKKNLVATKPPVDQL